MELCHSTGSGIRTPTTPETGMDVSRGSTVNAETIRQREKAFPSDRAACRMSTDRLPFAHRRTDGRPFAGQVLLAWEHTHQPS